MIVFVLPESTPRSTFPKWITESTRTKEYIVTLPSFMYNLPSTSPLGILTALATIVLAGFILWQASKVGLQQKLKAVLGAIALGVGGVVMLVTTLHLGLIQADFGAKTANNYVYGELPQTSAVALWAQCIVTVVFVGALVVSLLGRHAIAVAGSALLIAVSLATCADLGQFRMFEASWALGVTFGWLLVLSAAFGLVVTTAVVKTRAYGQRQYERGQKAALDAAVAKASSAKV